MPSRPALPAPTQLTVSGSVTTPAALASGTPASIACSDRDQQELVVRDIPVAAATRAILNHARIHACFDCRRASGVASRVRRTTGITGASTITDGRVRRSIDLKRRPNPSATQLLDLSAVLISRKASPKSNILFLRESPKSRSREATGCARLATTAENYRSKDDAPYFGAVVPSELISPLPMRNSRRLPPATVVM